MTAPRVAIVSTSGEFRRCLDAVGRRQPCEDTCPRCDQSPPCPNGQHRVVIDPRTGETRVVIWYCSVD